VVEYLPRKHKALSSSPSTTEEEEEGEERKDGEYILSEVMFWVT
jgi:hypothetical protein